MESAFQIKIVRENLALAIAIWAAAQRGVITAAFVPAETEFRNEDGDTVRIQSSLELQDSRELIRCAGNQIRGAFAFSALQTHRALEAVRPGTPLDEPDPDLRAARCVFYLLNQALTRNMMTPVWASPPEYARRFAVPAAGFYLDAAALEGKAITWDQFGGLTRYLSLLEYCRDRAAEAPPVWEKRPEAVIPAVVEAAPALREEPRPDPLTQLRPDVFPPQPVASPPVAAGITPAATPDVPSDGDPVSEFIAAQCTSGPESMSVAKDLYEAYVSWCQQRRLEPLAQRSFGMALTSRGFERRRRGRGKHWWVGVGLKTVQVAG